MNCAKSFFGCVGVTAWEIFAFTYGFGIAIFGEGFFWVIVVLGASIIFGIVRFFRRWMR